MEDVRRILVISRSTRECRKAVHYGVSLAKTYGAKLHVLHIMDNPFGLVGWSTLIPSLRVMAEEYRQMQQEAKAELDKIIEFERAKGMHVQTLVRDGDAADEILKVVAEEKIDLLIMLAHQEDRLEHLLFSRSTEKIIRGMPCSVMLVRQVLQPMRY